MHTLNVSCAHVVMKSHSLQSELTDTTPPPPATRPPPCPGAHFALSGAGRFPFQYKACLESNPPTSHCYKAKGKSCPFSALMISAVLVNQQVTQQQVVLEMLGASVYVYGAINIIYERESLSGA